MAENKKYIYEKPVSLNAGKIASVLGANCSVGDNASDLCRNGEGADLGCGTGNNPDVEPFCEATGATADGNCEQNGNTAGKTCYSNGGSAGWGCISDSG